MSLRMSSSVLDLAGKITLDTVIVEPGCPDTRKSDHDPIARLPGNITSPTGFLNIPKKISGER